jgi:hypothetical protein
MGWGSGARRLRAPVTAAVGILVSIAAATGLAGCGPPTSTSTGEPPATSAPTTTMPVDPEVEAGGELDPAALGGFVCAPDPTGAWTARGTLTNDGQAPAAYVVTVVVAGPDSSAVQAKRQVLALDSGASKPVEISTLPVPAEGELSCQAQVVRRS